MVKKKVKSKPYFRGLIDCKDEEEFKRYVEEVEEWFRGGRNG